jgi:predicted ATPase
MEESSLDEGAGIETGSLPPVLEELLLARIDSVPLRTREILQCAAVIGRTFQRRVLERASCREELDEDLLILLRAGMIREESFDVDCIYGFKHGLLREAALGSLPKRRKRAWHRRVAEALRDLVDDEDGEPVEALAFHYSQSDDVQSAIEYLIRAADRSVDVDGVLSLLETAAKLAGGVADVGQVSSRSSAATFSALDGG